jgi:hypothetical protein
VFDKRTYDVGRADRFFEGKWLPEPEYQAKLVKLEADTLKKAHQNIGAIRNAVADTNGTNRPGSTLGDGTSEAALLWEIQKGKPYKSDEGHYLKIANALDGIQKAIAVLRQCRAIIRDPQKIAEIDGAIESGAMRIDSMRPALEKWNTRVIEHPAVWNTDGTSKIQPGWPTDTSHK